MAVTRRTRFEVLRRDQHTCQYCGAKAPDATLHIDHVIPVSLGGDDKPGNLVTACKDCNAGKASISPDSPMVEAMSAEAAAYALGMVDKMTRFRSDLETFEDYEFMFREQWDSWTVGKEPIPLPMEYKASLFRWHLMGIPTSVFELAIPAAVSKFNRTSHMDVEGIFKYMAGVIWNMVNQREIDYSVTEETAAVYTSREMEERSQYDYTTGHTTGYRQGWRDADIVHHAWDFVQHHIDQTEMVLKADPITGRMKFTGQVRRRGT